MHTDDMKAMGRLLQSGGNSGVDSLKKHMDPIDDPDYAKKFPQFKHGTMESRPDDVWPSHAFWDKFGGGPEWQRRMGAAQSAVYGAANGLTFGVLKPVLRHLAPESAATLDGAGRQSHAGTAGEVAGLVANPLGGIYRAAGDKLARNGAGIYKQAGADMATAAAIGSVPYVIANDGKELTSLDRTAGAAGALRIVMPVADNNPMIRAAKGAYAGALAGVPMGGSEIASNVMGGAIYGAAARRPGSPASIPASRERAMNTLMAGNMAGGVGWGGTQVAPVLHDGLFGPEGYVTDTKIRRNTPELSYPEAKPSFK